MHFSRLSLIGALVVVVALGAVSSARGAALVSPAEDEAEAKLKRDTDDCRRRAVMHTGFDPDDPTAGEAPRKANHHTSPMPGPGGHVRALKPMSGPTGSVVQATDHRDEARARKKQQADEADLERQRAAYDRSVKTCLEGLNHAVEEHGALPESPGVPGLP